MSGADVSGVQPEAREIARQVAAIYRSHLGAGLHALVVHGSAVKGGLIIGSSDVDVVAFVRPDILTAGGEMPLELAIRMQRDLARIEIAPFRYLQGIVAAVGAGPRPGFIPGTYQVVTGSPDIPIATSQALHDAATQDLAGLDVPTLRDSISNGLLDHGEGRLSRLVRGLATKVWPAMFQVATLQLGDGLAAWQMTRPEAIALLGSEPVVGRPLTAWMAAITRHYAVGESVETALDALAAGVAFLESAALWSELELRGNARETVREMSP